MDWPGDAEGEKGEKKKKRLKGNSVEDSRVPEKSKPLAIVRFPMAQGIGEASGLGTTARCVSCAGVSRPKRRVLERGLTSFFKVRRRAFCHSALSRARARRIALTSLRAWQPFVVRCKLGKGGGHPLCKTSLRDG